MGGIILENSNCYTFTVQKMDLRNSGKGRIAIHFSKRDQAKRFEVVKVMCCGNGQHIFAAPIGLQDSENKDVVKLDRDLRDLLDLKVGQRIELQVTRANWGGLVWWYLTLRDPIIRVSAWLALISVGLGVLSIVLALN